MNNNILKRLRPRRIGAYIKLMAVIPTAIMALAFTFNTILERRNDARASLRSEAEMLAQLVGDGSTTALLSGNASYIEPLAESVLARPEVVAIQLTQANGEVLFKKEKPTAPNAILYAATHELFRSSRSIDPLASLSAAEATNASSKLIGSLKIVTSDEQLTVALKSKLFEDLLLGTAISVLVLIGSAVLSHRLSKRLQHITAVVRDIAGGQRRRVENAGSDEIAELGRNINGMLDSLHDAQLELENHLSELVSARDDADRANAEKHAFLGQISNEITGPLQQISAQLQQLKDNLDNTSHSEALDIAFHHVDSLHALYDDLLEFYLQNTNRLSVHKRYFNLVKTLDRIVLSHSSDANDKSIMLTVEYSGPDRLLSGYICSDPIRFRQIIQELLANALRYTFEGSVNIHAYFREVTPNTVNITVEVCDTGIGIALDQQSMLFEQLQGQVPYDPLLSDTTGLLIAGRTANTIGGTLTLRSRPGEGSTFTLEVSGEFSEVRSAHEEQTSAKKSPTSVLFVSSSKSSRRGIAELLGLSLSVDLVVGRENALTKYVAKNYDIVLLESLNDDSMFQLARSIRSALPRLTPIIAIVEQLTPARIALADEIGINHLISPPLRRYDLYKKIVQCTKIQESFNTIFNVKDTDP